MLILTVSISCGKYIGPAWSDRSVADKVRASGYEVVGFDFVKKTTEQISENPNTAVIVDVRSERAYNEGHIPFAVRLTDGYVDMLYSRNLDRFTDKNKLIITYCQGPTKIEPLSVANQLKKKGFKNIKVYVGGFPEWETKGFSEISQNYAKELYAGGDSIVIDARGQDKFEEDSIPGAINVPSEFIYDREYLMPSDKNVDVILYCGGKNCNEAYKVADYMLAKGYNPSALMLLQGGFASWVKNGFLTTSKGGSAPWIKPKPGQVKMGMTKGSVDVNTFNLIKEKGMDGVVIVDIRSEKDFTKKNIPNSVNADLAILYKRGCEEFIDKLPANKKMIFIGESSGKGAEVYYTLIRDCGYKETEKLMYLDRPIDFSGMTPVVR